MTPDELVNGAGEWLHRLGGFIVAPSGRTCRSGSGGRVINFGIIDGRARGAVHSVQVDDHFPSSPHWPVRIRLTCAATRELAVLLKRPSAFLPDPPTGCARKPQAPDARLIASACAAHIGHLEPLNDGLGHVLDLAEIEWCSMFDQVGNTQF